MSVQTEIDRIIAAVGAAYDAVEAKGGAAPAAQTIEGLAAAVGTIQTGIVPQLVVTVSAGATVTATNGSKTISGTSDSTGVCTLIVPEIGTWSVSATLDGKHSDTKIVTITDSYAVEIFFASPTLNDNEWSTIKRISDAGDGASYWSIGDRKAITLNGTVGALTLSNVPMYAFIIGFNHNSSVEGTNCIHFQLGKTSLSGGTDVALCDSYYNNTGGGFRMNTSNTNSGGWNMSKARTELCGTSLSSYSGTIIAVIPAALRAVLKSVIKYTNNKGNSSEANAVTATTDYFFLLSEYEVFGSITYGNTNEKSKQAQYSYYSAGNSKVKYDQRESNKAVHWWLRSPRASNTTSFVDAYSDGKVASNAAHYSIGFAPGFCV
jgi:hypothetical protein|nr:MAG TPA: hypothetical protein [Caudoviricetes sp.]